MPLAAAHWIVALGTLYAAIGVLFGVIFVTRGAGRVDAGACGAPILFRLLILPGAAALWPWMLHRWVRAESGSPEPGMPDPSHAAGAEQ